MFIQTWCILGIEEFDTSPYPLSWNACFVLLGWYSWAGICKWDESSESHVPSPLRPSSDEASDTRRNRDVVLWFVLSSRHVWTLTSQHLTVRWQFEHRNWLEGERWTLFDLKSASAANRRLSVVVVADGIVCVLVDEELVVVVASNGGIAKNVGGKVGNKILRCDELVWFVGV